MSAEWRLLPSRQRRLYAWVIAAAALVALWAARLDSWWSALLAIVALFTALQGGPRAGRDGVTGFAVRDGQWRLLRNGRSEPVDLVYWHFPWRRVGLLCFALPSGHRMRVSLFPDSLRDEDFRRLAVALA